jgi:serine/threonine protein kinase
MEGYKLKQYISRGAQAETYVALDLKTNTDVVLKIAHKCNMNPAQVKNMLQE